MVKCLVWIFGVFFLVDFFLGGRVLFLIFSFKMVFDALAV